MKDTSNFNAALLALEAVSERSGFNKTIQAFYRECQTKLDAALAKAVTNKGFNVEDIKAGKVTGRIINSTDSKTHTLFIEGIAICSFTYPILKQDGNKYSAFFKFNEL